MLQVDPSLFSNVVLTVQRTARLTGGAVRGLPNGVVIDGLQGVSSFGSDIAEAQKEFELGRVRSALDRVRQIEVQFNGITGRWSSTVGTVISTARQGRQQLPIQKLNEVKNAQAKMQQLTGPASKAFRDLISALEHAVSSEGHATDDATGGPTEDNHEAADIHEEALDEKRQSGGIDDEQPALGLLGVFSQHYGFGAKLRLQKGEDNKNRIVPQLEQDQYYFLAGSDPPQVVCIGKLQRQSVLVHDAGGSNERQIEAPELKALIQQGVWLLVLREPVD